MFLEIVCILCADHVFWYPWFIFRRIQQLCLLPSLFLVCTQTYLEVCVVERICCTISLVSRVLHVFSISLCGFLFLEPLFARVCVLVMYMGAREWGLRACATLLCHARVKTIGTSLCLTSSSLIVSATITERS